MAGFACVTVGTAPRCVPGSQHKRMGSNPWGQVPHPYIATPIQAFSFRSARWRCFSVFRTVTTANPLAATGAPVVASMLDGLAGGCRPLHRIGANFGRRAFSALRDHKPYPAPIMASACGLAPAVVDQVCVGCHGIPRRFRAPATARHCFADRTERKSVHARSASDHRACAGRSSCASSRSTPFHPGRSRRSG